MRRPTSLLVTALRQATLAAAIAALLVNLPGCQRGPSEEDLGTIIYEVPDVPGSDTPFPLPPLDPSAESEPSAESKDAGAAGLSTTSTPLGGDHEHP